MLNIRKEEMAGLVVLAVYGLALGALPHAFAANVLPEPKPVEVVVDPLDEFRNAKSLDGSELKSLLKAVGFEGKSLRVAWAVAMKESNGRPTAHNNNASTGDNSYGIFQINMLGQLGVDRQEKFELTSNKDLYDPVTNAQIAYFMTAGGTDWSSWKINPNTSNGPRYDSFYEEFPKGT